MKSLLVQKLSHVTYEIISHKFGKFYFSLGELFVGLRIITDMSGESVQAIK